jgi:hypothetical protein
MSAQRLQAFVVGVVALALTLTGLSLAATDPNPAGHPARDPLVLNGYPPTSVGLAFHVATDATFNLSGTVQINFRTNAAAAQLQIPLVLSSAYVTARAINGRVFANNVNLNAAHHPTWFTEVLHWPSLFGASLEMVKPDLSLITGFPVMSVHRSGYTTIYSYARQGVAIRPLSGRRGQSSVGSELWTIATGAQGEVTGTTLTLRTAHALTRISVQVLWYNHRVVVTPPPRADWSRPPSSLIADVKGTQLLHDFVIPTDLLRLGTSGSVA